MQAKRTERIALVVLTHGGLQLALRLQQKLQGDVDIYASQRVLHMHHGLVAGAEVTGFEGVKVLLTQLWRTYSGLVLFFALGAAVRLIAPLLVDKHHDPAVVVIDDAGHFAISVVSGHAGGANELARRCGMLLECTPVVTTASDVQHTLAVDLLSEKMGWHCEESSQLTAVAAAIVNGEPVAILQEAGQPDWWNSASPLPDNLIPVRSLQDVTAERYAALLLISDRLYAEMPEDVPAVVYRPPSLVLGAGCRRGVPFEEMEAFVISMMAAHGLALQSVAVLASADIKADEVALQQLAQRYTSRFETHPVSALRLVTGIVTPSERVERLTGTPSVSEAAALLSSQYGELIVSKQKGKDMTLAIARRSYPKRAERYMDE